MGPPRNGRPWFQAKKIPRVKNYFFNRPPLKKSIRVCLGSKLNKRRRKRHNNNDHGGDDDDGGGNADQTMTAPSPETIFLIVPPWRFFNIDVSAN